MAFDTKSFVEKYSTTKSTSGFDVEAFTKKYSNPIVNSGFDLNKFTSKYVKPKNNLKTSEGLYNLATQNGLKSQADRILATQTGEETKKIFSGGFISDIFDVLSALQYGVVGMAKGKSFSEGVKTRQSFTDQDALGDEGIPGVIGGIALDIAADPLTYIPIAGQISAVNKIIKATKIAKGLKFAKEVTFGKNVVKAIEGTDKTYQTLEGGTKLGKFLASKVKYMFGADPIFRETFERSVKNIAVGTQNIVKFGKSVAKLEPETAAKILVKTADGRFSRKPLEILTKELAPNELEPVINLYKTIDDLGKEAVDLGLLSKAKYEENIGEYLKNAYTEYELAKGKGLFPSKAVGIKGIKKRVDDLSPEQMKELGQIDNPAYLLFKSAFDLTKDVENAKLLKNVDNLFGTSKAQQGFTKIGDGKKWGALAGKYVPDNVAQYLNEIIEPAKNPFIKNTVANFKFFKVVMNPATHARNIISNKILNYWKLGMNPLDPRTISSEAQAVKEIAKGSGKWIDEALPLGYDLNSFASQEMKTMLDSPEAMLWGKTQKGWATMKQKLGDIYQGEENWAKLSAYIYNRTAKKLNPEDAWKAAESATFNYAQVTPFVRKLRESLFGFPFITFTAKVTPLALETAVKNPGRISIIQKIKQGIESQAGIEQTDKERANEPSWVKNGFYIKLPGEDKQGRSKYFDLTYIIPFGDLLSGGFFGGGTDMEKGTPKNPIINIAEKSPMIQVISSLAKNKDFYGNEIYRNSDTPEKQASDIMFFLAKNYIPPTIADQIPSGYKDGVKQTRGIKGALEASRENQKRNLSQELIRNLGIKIQPIDADIQETYTEWNRKKALETLLRDNGIMDKFDINFIPK